MKGIAENVAHRLGDWRGADLVDYRRARMTGQCLAPLAELDLEGLPWDTASDARPSRGVAGLSPPAASPAGASVFAGAAGSADEVTLVKRSDTRCVLSLVVLGPSGRPVRVYAKRCQARNWVKRLVSLGYASKSRREWRIGWRLLGRGIPTALPLLWAERRRWGMMSENYLVTLGVDQAVSFHDLWQSSAAPGERIFWLEQLAGFIRGTHARGFAHDDLSAKHVLVAAAATPESDSHTATEFFFIDLDHGRLRRAVGPFRRAHNFYQLFRSLPSESFGQEEHTTFFQAYSGGRWNDDHIAAFEKAIRLIALMKRVSRLLRPGRWLE